MNEQLIVKNFGPIKDATVDFKKVTVFIGPTGGGKSTLAKLAAIFRDARIYFDNTHKSLMNNYNISNYINQDSSIDYLSNQHNSHINNKLELKTKTREGISIDPQDDANIRTDVKNAYYSLYKALEVSINTATQNTEVKSSSTNTDIILQKISEIRTDFLNKYKHLYSQYSPIYIPSERVFVPAIEYSWAGLMRDDIGLPKTLLNFANSFSLSRKSISELYISFLNVTYLHIDGRDFIRIPEREEPLLLLETASGIQSAAPLLVLLEQLDRNIEQSQSFIIEEPELNLYPTAQQGLLNWLIEKCTTNENNLTITTHSPYILASCNLLMEAYKVWQQRPELEAEIDKIVPRASWINPDDFAAYYVDKEVRSIKDERTDLIGGNDLDAVSGSISDAFRSLLRLKKQPV